MPTFIKICTFLVTAILVTPVTQAETNSILCNGVETTLRFAMVFLVLGMTSMLVAMVLTWYSKNTSTFIGAAVLMAACSTAATFSAGFDSVSVTTIVASAVGFVAIVMATTLAIIVHVVPATSVAAIQKKKIFYWAHGVYMVCMASSLSLIW